MPLGDRPGHDALGQAAGLHAQVETGRQGHAGLAEVIGQVVVDLLRRAEHGENVDEAEELRAEGGVLHGPRHELVGPEAGREEALAVLADAGQQPPADLEGALLKIAAGGRVCRGGSCRFVFEPGHYEVPLGRASALLRLYPRELYRLCRLPLWE